MFKEKITYGYNDVFIQPAAKSLIEHRSECEVLKGSTLPIFTAPMSTVVSEKNAHVFEQNNIIPIIPRNVPWGIRKKFMNEGKWIACSLSEFQDIVSYHNNFQTPPHILIDVANGNMAKLIQMCKDAKSKYGKTKIVLMAGNIANPDTYIEYCKAGIDYVRCGIGSGCGCITSSNVGIHYGIVNLLKEIHKEKEFAKDMVALRNKEYRCATQVIADGGIRNYDDVIKALALGADYVMIGSVFASLVESCAPTFYYDKDEQIHSIDTLDSNVKLRNIDKGVFSYSTGDDEDSDHILCNVYKVFYGMASRRGQEDLYGEKKHTAEGIEKQIPCTTNIDKWVQNMKDNLASAMSYCNVRQVSNFNPSTVDTYIASNNLKESINK